MTNEARLFDSISDDIRSRVARGELKPGQKLRSERDLAEHYGVSRSGVREALRGLERGGVIELRKGPKGGTFIRGADPALVTQSLNDVISLGAVSIASLTESRTIVMTAVTRLACERGTDADFDRLDASITLTEQLAKAGDLEGRRIQLLSFYRLLGETTGNEVLVILVSSLTDLVLKLMSQYDVGPWPTTSQTHRKIVGCLRRRSGDEAVALMAGHLDKLHAYFRKSAMKTTPRAP
ncbi:FadR family transcriptional regulator [Variovorax sp. WS11]|uniref:FadR/GntR family transcriptional regulator n=1 Tax=Variovorax sp. WS11 TaxID=1105204 RepID=UPI000D0D6047|nr:FCD domain-containing protein [Variovorax sp. WS11]NDZ18935.1 FadR family transcriptional regulator [Variovorax sp. WS11]PSL82444.1 FadR family transcriptional regulator [Variovorax sp. WS11]